MSWRHHSRRAAPALIDLDGRDFRIAQRPRQSLATRLLAAITLATPGATFVALVFAVSWLINQCSRHP